MLSSRRNTSVSPQARICRPKRRKSLPMSASTYAWKSRLRSTAMSRRCWRALPTSGSRAEGTRRHQGAIVVLVRRAVLGRAVVVHALVFAAVRQEVAELAELKRQVVQQHERAEALLHQPIEVVLERRLDERPALPQVAGGGHRKRQAPLRDPPRRLLDELDVGVLRRDARRGVGAHAEVDVTRLIERRAVRARRDGAGEQDQQQPSQPVDRPCRHIPPKRRDGTIL